MSSAKYYRTEGLTLKNMPLGESDLLVTLYCKDIGKMRAVAKGARKSTSKLVGHFEPLTINNISITKSTNLDIINQAETIEDFDSLKSNLIGMAQGIYINELLDGFAPESLLPNHLMAYLPNLSNTNHPNMIHMNSHHPATHILTFT
jgi:DNA repair protein RecO (recombination protein O)